MAKIYLDAFYHSKYPKCKEYFLKAFFGSKDRAINEEEYLWIIQNCEDLPQGLVWARTPIGAPPGKYLIYVKKPTKLKFSNTFLEEEFEKILHKLGYVKKKIILKIMMYLDITLTLHFHLSKWHLNLVLPTGIRLKM